MMKKINKKELIPTDQSVVEAQNLPENKVFIGKGCNYNTTNTVDLSSIKPYSIILSLIGEGEKNAVHLDKLVGGTGEPERTVRKCIEQLRRSGKVIVSNINGYFIPETPEELRKYIKQETHRAKSVVYTLKNARQLLQQIGEVEQWQKDECLQKQ